MKSFQQESFHQFLFLKLLKRRCYLRFLLQEDQVYFLLNLCSNVQKLTMFIPSQHLPAQS